MPKKSLFSLSLALTVTVVAAGFLYVTNQTSADIGEPQQDTVAAETGNSDSAPSLERAVVTTYVVDHFFTDVPETGLNLVLIDKFIGARAVGAYRVVLVDSDALRFQIRQLSNGSEGLTLYLVDSTPVQLSPVEAEEHSAGWQSGFATWRGTIDGDGLGSAYFVVSPDGTVNGVFLSPMLGRIKIEPIKGTSHHVIWTLRSDFEWSID